MPWSNPKYKLPTHSSQYIQKYTCQHMECLCTFSHTHNALIHTFSKRKAWLKNKLSNLSARCGMVWPTGVGPPPTPVLIALSCCCCCCCCCCWCCGWCGGCHATAGLASCSEMMKRGWCSRGWGGLWWYDWSGRAGFTRLSLSGRLSFYPSLPLSLAVCVSVCVRVLLSLTWNQNQ